MDPQWWHSFFRFLAMGASFTTFISLVGTWYFASKLDQQKNKEITSLTSKAEEAEERQAGAERELREVQTQQRPRTLTPAQIMTLITRLQGGPTGKIQIVALEGNAEAFRFAGQLYRVVEVAGWTIEGFGQGMDIVEVWVGLRLVRSRIDMAPHGEVLLHSLRAIGFEVAEQIHPDVEEGLVRLIVGQKPGPRP